MRFRIKSWSAGFLVQSQDNYFFDRLAGIWTTRFRHIENEQVPAWFRKRSDAQKFMEELTGE